VVPRALALRGGGDFRAAVSQSEEVSKLLGLTRVALARKNGGRGDVPPFFAPPASREEIGGASPPPQHVRRA
jgi:hypothetical protein